MSLANGNGWAAITDRSSRDLGDSGDHYLNSIAEECVQHAPIKFLSPRNLHWTVSIPRVLVDRAYRGGKHSGDLKYELALLWRRYVVDGEFSISMRMLNELYSSRFRKKLKAILDDTAIPTRTHSSYPDSARSRAYKFKFRRTKQKWPTYSDIPPEPDDPSLVRTNLVAIVIPAAWLWDRYERWSEICIRYGWTSNVDLDGTTEWGRPLFAALESTLIPETAETARLTQRGVAKAARRNKGRCYHPLTNMRKDLRRDSILNGEPTAEVDIHACYSCLLVSRLPDGFGKDRAIGSLQTDWYSQFSAAYSDWLKTQHEMGTAYEDSNGRWMIRQDDEPKYDVPASIKVEYQRQCLFWRDGRDASNPLRMTLNQLHPELGYLISIWRGSLTPSELSNILTRAEGSLVVDYTMAELERAGIVAVPIHDAVVVPESKTEETRDIFLRVCEWHLGFRPKISIKTPSKAQLQL